MKQFAVFVEGIESLQQFDKEAAAIHFKAVQAINTTARNFRSQAAKRMRAMINFPDSYLNPAGKRLFVSRQATRGKPEAAITARGRPTSLARFVTGYRPGHLGVTLEVAQGKQTRMGRAFLINLPAGAGGIDTKSNQMLAIRLKKGETLKNKRNVKRMDRNLYLLYGPSIDQVFLNATGAKAGQGVATDMTPDMLDFMEREFLRLMDL